MSRNLFILFHGRFPSEKAAALFAADTARAFSPFFSVTLVVPSRFTHIQESAHNVYGLPKEVASMHIPVIDLFSVPLLSKAAFLVSMLCYSIGVFFALMRARSGDVVISNDPLPALIATFSRAGVSYEVHDYPEHWKGFYRLLFSRVSLIIATNLWKHKALARDFPEAKEHILMERNGVDLSLFRMDRTKEESRKVLDISPVSPVVVYTGHLYDWKGTKGLADTASTMPDFQFYFIGGTPEDVARYRKEYASFPHMSFVGHVPHDQVPLWQAAADALVLPNTGTQDIGAQYTSPMKLFEYMASERPIVAARLPAIAEIVTDESAYLFTPDDSGSLAEAIRAACTTDASSRATRAREDVEAFSWNTRIKRLMRYAPFAA